MLEYFKQNPKYIFLIVALLILTLWVCYKAGQASLRHSRETEKIISRLKRENTLCNKYAFLTPELISGSDPLELFEGVGLNLQKRVADSGNMNEEFALLTEWEKRVYALLCLMQDGSEDLTEFFRLNGEPVSSICLEAVGEYCESPEAFTYYKTLYDMFDENNETVSFSEEEAKKAAEEFSALCPLEGLFIKCARSAMK